MKFVNFFLIILFSAALVSCNKDQRLTQKKDAVIKYTGDYAVDGCGYFLVVDGIDYKPTNEKDIDDSYKVDGEKTEVIAEYIVVDEPPKRFCFGPGEYLQVNIITLTKK